MPATKMPSFPHQANERKYTHYITPQILDWSNNLCNLGGIGWCLFVSIGIFVSRFIVELKCYLLYVGLN